MGGTDSYRTLNTLNLDVGSNGFISLLKDKPTVKLRNRPKSYPAVIAIKFKVVCFMNYAKQAGHRRKKEERRAEKDGSTEIG